LPLATGAVAQASPGGDWTSRLPGSISASCGVSDVRAAAANSVPWSCGALVKGSYTPFSTLCTTLTPVKTSRPFTGEVLLSLKTV